MTLGFLLMSGGHSSRMGTPKALLDIGGETLLSRIARAGAAFPERILSVNDPSIPTPEGFARVEDVYTDCGPMGGLHAALKAASCDALGYGGLAARQHLTLFSFVQSDWETRYRHAPVHVSVSVTLRQQGRT